MTASVQFRAVTKRYGSLIACDSVSFDAHAGRVHAIVGENGAGKSTLMKLLAGFLRPDSGEIRIEGEALHPTPRAARAAGVGLCAQHFHQVPTLTGLENILLGASNARWFSRPERNAEARVRALMDRYGLQTDLDRPVQDLSIGEQERIEILSLLHRDSRILILDEPTAVLAPTEIASLFEVLRRLASEGRTIFFVTHKLPEMMEIADHVLVLRRGRLVDAMTRAKTVESFDATRASGAEPPPHRVAPVEPFDVSHASDAEVPSQQVEDMAPFDAGRIVAGIVGEDAPVEVGWTPRTKGALVLEARNVSAGDARSRIENISLRLHAGEILGIGGVEGNGQTALVQTLLGHLERRAGTIFYRGAIRSAAGLREMRASTAVIPEDRHEEALMLRRSVADNAVLGMHQRAPFSRHGWLDRSAIEEHAKELVREYGVRPAELDRTAGALSGGNQQRLVVGRELMRDPDLLIAVHPTRGVDLAATGFIHAQLLAARERGKAILLVSADLTELFALADHVAILYRGQIEYEADRSELEPARAQRALLGLERTAGA